MSNDIIEEEGNMNTPAGTLRKSVCLLFTLLIAAAFAACGDQQSE
jgi:hypothetical protein